MRFLIILLVFFLSFQATAWVDLKTGNYTHQAQDFVIESVGPVNSIHRTYNSKSPFEGMFGLGWCSNLETSIKVHDDKTIALRECGAGRIQLFTSPGFSKKTIQQGLKKLEAHLKKENPKLKLSKTYLSDLQKDIYLRDDIIRAANYMLALKDGLIYTSADDQIIYKKDKFILKKTSGEVWSFSKTGKALNITDKNKQTLSFQYDKNRLKSVTDNFRNKFVFSYASNGLVNEIRSPKGLTAKYKYNKDRSLVESNIAGFTEAYEYDENRSLNNIHIGKVKKKIIYDRKNRDIAEIRVGKCKAQYKYKNQSPKTKKIELIESCSGKVREQAKYDIKYSTRLDGSVFPSELRSYDKKGQKLEIKYIDENKPLLLKRLGLIVRYKYDNKGRLILEDSGSSAAKVTYDKSGRISKIITTVQNSKKKQAVINQFLYNPNGSLRAVKSKDGLITKLSYDKLGRIRKIKNSKGQVATLDYEKKTSFAKSVFVNGLGRTSIILDSNGLAEGVRIPASTKSATAVLATYEKIIQPALPALRMME